MPRGLPISHCFGIIVINFRYPRLQMPLYEGAISIFDAAAVIAALQNFEPCPEPYPPYSTWYFAADRLLLAKINQSSS